MKRIPTFEQFNKVGEQSHIEDDVLNQLEEKKSDGTISDDEEEREEELMAHAESAIDELIAKIKGDANDIGGSFRAPGIEYRVGKLLAAKLKKAKLI